MGGNMYKKLLSQLCHISRRIDLSFVHCFQVLTVFSFQYFTFLSMGKHADISACGALPAPLAGEVLWVQFESPTYNGNHQPAR